MENSNLILVKNEPKFYGFIHDLRYRKENVSGFIDQTPVSEIEQNNYMEKYGKHYYIAILNETPVGFVGVIDNDIRVATHPDYKNMGIGKFMINEIIKIYPNSIAKIKSTNSESIKLFESCGFEVNFLIMKK